MPGYNSTLSSSPTKSSITSGASPFVVTFVFLPTTLLQIILVLYTASPKDYRMLYRRAFYNRPVSDADEWSYKRA
ncbi:hypothetical protein ACFLUX_03530, partial [Chloroflexota bacterium]